LEFLKRDLINGVNNYTCPPSGRSDNLNTIKFKQMKGKLNFIEIVLTFSGAFALIILILIISRFV